MKIQDVRTTVLSIPHLEGIQVATIRYPGAPNVLSTSWPTTAWRG